MRFQTAGALFLAASLTLAANARLGPPIICQQIDIGQAQSLAWGSGAFAFKPGAYDHTTLVHKISEVLKGQHDPLVRMETLRRAAVYIARDVPEPQRRGLAWELLGESACRALHSEAAGKPEAEAWFDAAFWIASFDQAGVDLGAKVGSAEGVTGYGYMRKALALIHESDKNGSTASAMEFAAALMTHPAMRHSEEGPDAQSQYDAHLRLAAAGAAKGSLLEQNLAAHLMRFGRTLDQVRAQASAAGPKK
jgi:hypothetical protein